MNRFQNPTPRTAFAIAAIALTALTIGVAVVVPAAMDSSRQEASTLATQKMDSPEPIQAVIDPARIEVSGVRDPGFVSVHVRNLQPKRKQQS